MSSTLKDIVLVLGTTGVGKSNLAIDLALSSTARGLPAEIINTDSMQIYSALPILTAKVSAEEQAAVPHHLMSFLDPVKDRDYQVLQFKADATSKVRIRRARRMKEANL